MVILRESYSEGDISLDDFAIVISPLTGKEHAKISKKEETNIFEK